MRMCAGTIFICEMFYFNFQKKLNPSNSLIVRNDFNTLDLFPPLKYKISTHYSKEDVHSLNVLIKLRGSVAIDGTKYINKHKY